MSWRPPADNAPITLIDDAGRVRLGRVRVFVGDNGKPNAWIGYARGQQIRALTPTAEGVLWARGHSDTTAEALEAAFKLSGITNL